MRAHTITQKRNEAFLLKAVLAHVRMPWRSCVQRSTANPSLRRDCVQLVCVRRRTHTRLISSPARSFVSMEQDPYMYMRMQAASPLCLHRGEVRQDWPENATNAACRRHTIGVQVR